MFRLTLYLVSIIIGGWVGVAYVESRKVELPVPKPVATEKPIVETPRITYYQAVWWQTDSSPNVSSCGPNISNQVAVSRDLMGGVVDCGSVIRLWSDTVGYLGEYTVWDVTNKRFSSTVDVLVEAPPAWGKTSGYFTVEGKNEIR